MLQVEYSQELTAKCQQDLFFCKPVSLVPKKNGCYWDGLEADGVVGLIGNFKFDSKRNLVESSKVYYLYLVLIAFSRFSRTHPNFVSVCLQPPLKGFGPRFCVQCSTFSGFL